MLKTKKRIALGLTLAMLLVLFAACGRQNVVEPTRGTWEDNVFTSEYLGLRFVLPTAWLIASEFDIAMLMGVTVSALEAAGSRVPSDITSFYDMMASNPYTGANVQIIYERYGRRTPTADEFIEATTEAIADIGGTVTRVSGTTRIGAYNWHSYSTQLISMGQVIHGRQFFTIQDGYIRLIVITYTDLSESLDDILPMFIGLNDPIPQPQRAEVLVGTWAWEWDDEYLYVFHADGRGTRGFAPILEEFEWETLGNDHLLINTVAMLESWSFSIIGDVLTIESRQMAGMIYSYIRQ